MVGLPEALDNREGGVTVTLSGTENGLHARLSQDLEIEDAEHLRHELEEAIKRAKFRVKRATERRQA